MHKAAKTNTAACPFERAQRAWQFYVWPAGGAKSLNLTHQWMIPNRHRSAPAGCRLTVFDFEKAILTSIRDKSFLHQLLNFRPPPASPKIAGAILGEVQAYALT